jgi:hypothetical protein
MGNVQLETHEWHGTYLTVLRQMHFENANWTELGQDRAAVAVSNELNCVPKVWAFNSNVVSILAEISQTRR